MSLFSIVGDLFGKKEKGGDLIDTTPRWLQTLGKTLGTQLNAGISTYTPGDAYKGNLNFAGSPTDAENKGLGILKELLSSSGTGPLYEGAFNHLNDTLQGKFADPATSPYIKAMQKVFQNNLNDQITQERGARGARGSYFTSAAVDSENKLRGRSLDNLNSIIGQFIQNERGNMLNATDKATELDKFKNLTLPLAKVSASQSYGGLTRLIEQSNLESQYQDYLRQRKEQGSAVNTAASLPDITDIGQVRTPKYMANNDLGNVMSILDRIGGDQGVIDLLNQAGGSGGSGGGISSIIKLLPQLLAMGAA